MENVNTSPKRTNKDMYIETPLGTLHVYEETDLTHPGVYIDLIRKGIPYAASLAVVEADTDENNRDVISCKMWSDVSKEDYTDDVRFSNVNEFFGNFPTNLSEALHDAIVDLKNKDIPIKEYAALDISYIDRYGEDRTARFNISERIDTEEGENDLYDLINSFSSDLLIDTRNCTAADSVTGITIVATADTEEELDHKCGF